MIRVQSLRKNVWSALLTLLGLNLWALMCLMPLGVEWAAQDTRRLCVFVYLLPLIFLSVGLLVRWAGLLLLLFPASFLPVYLVLPEADRGIHETAVGWLTLAVSVVMYVCVAAMWSRENPPLLFARSGRVSLSQRRSGSDLVAESIGQPPLGRHLWWPYRWYFLPRWCFLFLLVVVPFYGLNFSEGVADVYAADSGARLTMPGSWPTSSLSLCGSSWPTSSSFLRASIWSLNRGNLTFPFSGWKIGPRSILFGDCCSWFSWQV